MLYEKERKKRTKERGIGTEIENIYSLPLNYIKKIENILYIWYDHNQISDIKICK